MSKNFAMQRFMSLKWKSAIALVALLLAILSVLAWHYQQRFERQFTEHLSEQRLAAIEAMEATIHRTGESLHRILKSFVMHPLDVIATDTNSNTTPTPEPSFTNYREQLDKHFPSLLQHWGIDEALIVDGNSRQQYQRHADSNTESWLVPWAATTNLSGLSPISIHCELGSCQQVFNFPLFDANQRMGFVIVKRPFLLRATEFNQATGAHIGLLTRLPISEISDLDASATPILSWSTALFLTEPEQHFIPGVLQIAQQYPVETLMGTTLTVVQDGHTLAITVLPIRGFNPNEYRYLIVADVTVVRQALIAQLLQEVVVIVCLVFVFVGYLIALSWKYFARIRQQIQVIPLIADKEFKKARDIVSTKRHKTLYRDELDILDDTVTSLTYQLESLEKAVSVRTREMERLSLFDSLTGLANRNLFQYELQSDVQRFTQQGGVLAAVILDLDKFKRINDTIGHQQGDLLLGKIAQRLKNATKSVGLVARLGGDEFAIILRSAKKVAHIEILCQKILELIHKPIELDGHNIVVSCSLGIALATADQNADDLLKNAEIAMYNAKEKGGNHYRIFDEAMALLAHANLSLESDLRRAFEQSEFTLYLQPKVTMDQEIDGFEALVRWDHPDRGIVAPIEFIPALENLGLINQLDNFVLDTSCRQLSVLQKHYPKVSIAVNISSVHFTDKDFIAFVKTCLAKYPIDPSRLELEITETLLMENMNAGMEAIREIKELGVSIAIDDFGTGYSSLSYLKKLPVDTIKIDREFIKDIPDSESDMQISSVIIFLAKQLNFKVVAEGVETKEQLVFLKANQCDLAQGYLFSRPVPAHKAIIMLETQRGEKKIKKLG